MSPANLVARLRLPSGPRSCASLILFDVVSTVAAAAAVMTLSAYSSYPVMLIIHSLVETITYHHIFYTLFPFFFHGVCRISVGVLFGMHEEHWLSPHFFLLLHVGGAFLSAHQTS